MFRATKCVLYQRVLRPVLLPFFGVSFDVPLYFSAYHLVPPKPIMKYDTC